MTEYRPIGRKHAKVRTSRINVHKLSAMLIIPSFIVTMIELYHYWFHTDWEFIPALVGGIILWVIGFMICSWLDIK